MPTFERHVFVCTNERSADHPRGSCKAKGSEDVRDAFKKQLAARGLKSLVRANAAGCLDQCERGVSVVVYPEQVWYGQVTVGDVAEIVDSHVVGGRVVTRLMQPDQPHLHGRDTFPAIEPPQESKA
jgi:(2Fe-2S) ferredoxin